MSRGLDTVLRGHDMPIVLKRLPVIPTIIVALAVAVMVALGVWQLQRGAWKQDLLARFDANRGLPPIAFPAVPVNAEKLFFRRASGFCMQAISIRATAGRNMAGESGWSHIASCRGGGAEGPGMTVDIGWSAAFDAPVTWRGGAVAGVIAPDSRSVVRLVAAAAAPGLVPSAPPGPDTIANNHGFYAVQWFFFAGAAALIYALVIRRRSSKPAKAPRVASPERPPE